VFSGHVLIVQGPMRLQAETVTVQYDGADRSRISRLHATGGVTLVSKTEAAEAKEALYQVGSGAVELTGDVLVTQGANVLSGQHMTIDLKTGTGRMDGRVGTILQTGTQP
jgi:lipopolysaccharide export system protein LptA